MSWIYRHCIRPVLFSMESEDIHNRLMENLEWISHRPPFGKVLASFCETDPLPVQLFGLEFPNPVGLAAGMDKDALALPIWRAFGFGFVEIGAVTREAQPGNPRPRLFRAIADEALVNRMGFNSCGAQAMAAKLQSWKQSGLWPACPVGINLGKTRQTPLDQVAAEYAEMFRRLNLYGDFFVVNVSSPNTPGLRKLQDKEHLEEILSALAEIPVADSAEPRPGHPKREPSSSLRKPILLKISPDLSPEALDDILEVSLKYRIDGLVATNTTESRPEERPDNLRRIYAEPGGLSGRPLRERSTEIIRYLYRQSKGTLPIVGSGGIFTADDAWEKITAGARLLEVYTGFVYQGPTLQKALVEGLLEHLSQCGLKDLSQAVGLKAWG